MAIMVQEVTLRIVYDDSDVYTPPQHWNWQKSLTVDKKNVGQSFVVADVHGTGPEPATSAEAVEFVVR